MPWRSRGTAGNVTLGAQTRRTGARHINNLFFRTARLRTCRTKDMRTDALSERPPMRGFVDNFLKSGEWNYLDCQRRRRATNEPVGLMQRALRDGNVPDLGKCGGDKLCWLPCRAAHGSCECERLRAIRIVSFQDATELTMEACNNRPRRKTAHLFYTADGAAKRPRCLHRSAGIGGFARTRDAEPK